MASRPVGPMYKERIERALRRHAKMPLRSEKHGRYRDLYVDIDQLPLLDTLDWQVLYGRRGTGKTLMLGTLQERIDAEKGRFGHLSILISAEACKVSPASAVVSDKTRALGYFQSFLELLMEELATRVDGLVNDDGFLARFTGERKRTVDRVFESMVELLELANVGHPVAAYSAIEISEERSNQRDHTDLGSVGADVKLDHQPRFAARAGASRESRREASESESTSIRSESVPHFSAVSRVLNDLLATLRIQRMTILMDEWSHLDPTGATAIQPEFAELLKRTFRGVPQVTVKLATNRYQTRFSNRGAGGSYRGLELEADMFEAMNLDRAVLERADLDSFFETLLFNRLSLQEESLKELRPPGQAVPSETFILSMFRDRRAFGELVKGAEGIPREFLLLFNAVASVHRHSVADRWGATAIQSVIRQRSISGLDDIEYHSVTGQLMDPCIKQVIARTGSRIFFVHRDHHAQISDGIDELLEKRMIHEFPREELPGFLRGDRRAYSVSYGTWLDWERTRGSDVPVSSEVGLPQGLTDIGEWQVDPSLVERENLRTCPHCGHAFTTDAPSYTLKGLCPECFERDPEAEKVLEEKNKRA